MNRTVKLVALGVAICMISFLFGSCGNKDDGNTSGNASNGVISRDPSSKSDKSEGGFVSGVISKGEEVVSEAVSKVGDAVSGVISDIMSDDKSEQSHASVVSDASDSSANSEDPSTVSFVSEGEVSNV